MTARQRLLPHERAANFRVAAAEQGQVDAGLGVQRLAVGRKFARQQQLNRQALHVEHRAGVQPVGVAGIDLAVSADAAGRYGRLAAVAAIDHKALADVDRAGDRAAVGSQGQRGRGAAAAVADKGSGKDAVEARNA